MIFKDYNALKSLKNYTDKRLIGSPDNDDDDDGNEEPSVKKLRIDFDILGLIHLETARNKIGTELDKLRYLATVNLDYFYHNYTELVAKSDSVEELWGDKLSLEDFRILNRLQNRLNSERITVMEERY